eukprot:COSAG04_NODE_4010_length_2363_cov_1.268993_2_plen_341_part_00
MAPSEEPLLASAAAATQQAEPPPLSTWRLIFINSFFLLSAAPLYLVQGVLLPAQVAAAVPRAEQDVALGLCSAIGSATQLIQPPVGALSDRQGRRRPWMLLGQFLCSAGCIALLLARGTWQLTAAFTTFMLGASISWGAYMCIVPEYVPPSQHGAASGMLGLMVQGGQALGSGVGYFAGNGGLSLTVVYWGCAVVNLLGGLTSWLSLDQEPVCCAPPPHQQGATVQAGAGGEAGIDAGGRSGFFSGFRSRAFSAVFMAIFVSSFGGFFAQTFTQYYLQDAIAQPPDGSTDDGSADVSTSEPADLLVAHSFHRVAVGRGRGSTTSSTGSWRTQRSRRVRCS